MLTRRDRQHLPHILLLAVGIWVLMCMAFSAPETLGLQLQQRSLTVSNSAEGATGVVYTMSFNIETLGTLGSMEFEFCSNDPFIGDPCTAPAGLNVLSATLASQTGQTGFSINGNSTVNDLILSRTPAVAGAGTVSYTFTNIANPDTAGSYYLRILTYASNDASGPATDTGALAFVMNPSISLSAQVPPFLLLCTGTTINGFDCTTASGDYIDFGDFASDRTSAAATQIVVATNAQNGYGLFVTGTTLTAGNNTIPAMSVNGSSKTGVSQFGINLAGNTNPQVGADVQGPGTAQVAPAYGTGNSFRFVPGERIAGSSGPDDFRKYTVSYIVNVAKGQPPGVYSSTLTYVATASF